MALKVSIIIPVYNGEKYIKKTIEYLLKQDYSDLEIILVENNSSDNSWEVCKEMQQKDSRIHAYTVTTKGTSLARKYGVLHAQGDYILFHDQDDSIPDASAVTNMVRAIETDQTDICQFGYIKTLGGFLKKKIPAKLQPRQMFTRQELMESQIKGILGFGWSDRIVLSPQVWNKIYRAEILKEAVSNINESLYFCEDEYLNIFAFFSEKTNSVSVRDEYYYHWNTGIGFSSSENANRTFLRDYQTIKNASIPLIKRYSTEDVLASAYRDSLMVYKWAIYGMLYKQSPKQEIIKFIEEIEKYQYIQEAKAEMSKLSDVKYSKDIECFITDYTPSGLYEFCKLTLPVRSKKTIIKDYIKKVIVNVLG